MIFKRYIIFFFVLLACSENNNNETYTINFGSETSFDIVTWNLEYFPKDAETISYLLDFIPSINSDIYALQEIASQNSFNQLVNQLGPKWVGFRSGDSNGQDLAYIINSNYIDVINGPYEILEEEDYFFAFRPPYVLEVAFNDINYIIINVHFKCCNDSPSDSYRRSQASYYLKEYIDNNFGNERVIVLGDFNDDITEPDSTNVFIDFLNDSENYFFTDMYIAEGTSSNWSFPSWPSHLDHILVTNELFTDTINTFTIKLDDYIIGGFQKYDNHISDHRPVGINL